MKLVQYFLGILYSPLVNSSNILTILSDAIGGVDEISPEYSFDSTAYYEEEMGSGLKRFFCRVKKLGCPHELVSFKNNAIMLEKEFFSKKGRRLVNVDPGYLDSTKIVLASTKFGGHKIALSDLIYADMVLDYSHGGFRPFEWTFPDFKSGIYFPYFKALREKYLLQI